MTSSKNRYVDTWTLRYVLCVAIGAAGCFAPPLPNRTPEITSSTSIEVEENVAGTFYTATSSDRDDDPPRYSLSGVDAEAFAIDSDSGELEFLVPPDAENPRSASGDNTYEVTLEVDDGQGKSSEADLTVSVLDVVELAIDLSISPSGEPESLSFQWTADGDELEDVQAFTVEVDRSGSGEFVALGDSVSDLERSVVTLEAYHLLRWQTVSYRIAANGSDGATIATSPPVALRDVVDPAEAVFEIVSDPTEGVCNAIAESFSIDALGETIAFSFVDDSTQAGRVDVLVRNGAEWTRETPLTASNGESRDAFGSRIALAKDGRTLLVGAPGEDSNTTGAAAASSTNNGALESGAAYVFERGDTGGSWTEALYVKATNTGADDAFGSGVAVSAQGATIAIGAPAEDSDAVGVGGDASNDDRSGSGAVYVYRRVSAGWAFEGYLKASNPGENDRFGERIAISDDGATLVIAAPDEDSDSRGIDSDGSNDDASNSGAVYVFSRDGVLWSEQAYIKSSNPNSQDAFGTSLGVSGDGDTLIVGAPGEDGLGEGVNANPNDRGDEGYGAAYIFERTGRTWEQTTYLKPIVSGNVGMEFGGEVAVSSDGEFVVVGAPLNSNPTRGLLELNAASLEDAGAVFVFERGGDRWQAIADFKSEREVESGQFGARLSFANDGRTLLVGEADSCINDADQSVVGAAGSVYVY
ncbi:MAG: hypothetical protein AAF219_09710 [Myxococcota bacterium]